VNIGGSDHRHERPRYPDRVAYEVFGSAGAVPAATI
jgi:hypothetical protein